MLEFIESVTAVKTNDSVLSAENPASYTAEELVVYLNEDPRHALVVTDLAEVSGECVVTGPVYVLRGAGEGLGDFYFGSYPAEDPNDAEGGDLTADAALAQALDLLCS